MKAANQLVIYPLHAEHPMVKIPESEIEFAAMRASGPGGHFQDGIGLHLGHAAERATKFRRKANVPIPQQVRLVLIEAPGCASCRSAVENCGREWRRRMAV